MGEGGVGRGMCRVGGGWAERLGALPPRGDDDDTPNSD